MQVEGKAEHCYGVQLGAGAPGLVLKSAARLLQQRPRKRRSARGFSQGLTACIRRTFQAGSRFRGVEWCFRQLVRETRLAGGRVQPAPPLGSSHSYSYVAGAFSHMHTSACTRGQCTPCASAARCRDESADLIAVVSRSFGEERRPGERRAWEANDASSHALRDVVQNRNP